MTAPLPRAPGMDHAGVRSVEFSAWTPEPVNQVNTEPCFAAGEAGGADAGPRPAGRANSETAVAVSS